MDGCEKELLATTRPEMIFMVKQPVIYLHNVKGPGKIVIKLKRGEFSMIYPNTSSRNIVEWNYKPTNKTPQLFKALIPRQDLMSIAGKLNSASDQFLIVNNTLTGFLYYEFKVNLSTKIKILNISYKGDPLINDIHNASVLIHNDNDYSLRNVLFTTVIHGKYFFLGTTLRGYIDEIPPHSEKTIYLSTDKEIIKKYKEKWFNDLISSGLTEKEAKTFIDLWSNNFFYPQLAGSKILIYRYPNSEYEKLVTIKGGSIKRAIYAYIHFD